MQQWRNGPSIYANQKNQQGAHKSKDQSEFATERLRNELAGELQKPPATEATSEAARRHLIRTSPKLCGADFRGNLACNWVRPGRFNVCFGICSLEFQALSSRGKAVTTFIL
jgi:hypothetical protein